MVYFFHTTYAREELKYLVKEHPDYKLYDGHNLREKDVLIIAVYVNLLPLAEFINLTEILDKDAKKYGSLYMERFRFINLNINDDKQMQNSREYIYHSDLKPLFMRPNSKILLYNSWETRNLYRCSPVIIHYCNFHNIPTSKLLLSMTDHQHMFKKYPAPRVISYDWQYIRAKRIFSHKNTVSRDLPKPKHIICFNSRSNDERLAAAGYLYTNYREKCYLSFLHNKRSFAIEEPMMHLAKNFISPKNFNLFKQAIPFSLEKGLQESIEDSYFMLMFETNIVRSGCQQISEKTYRPILAGIPFMLWGSQGGVLAHLRKMGFKTFSPFIDEAYDNPKYSYIERYVRLINEVSRICSLDTHGIESLYQQCVPMVKHNFTVLESRENIPTLL
jgi:hypothetical protein